MKEYLQRVHKLKEEIKLQQSKLQSWEEIATRTGGAGGSGGGQADAEFAVIRIIEIKVEIARLQEQLEDAEAELLHFIQMQSLNETDKAILELRYLGDKKWEEIGQVLGYTTNWILKKHSSILRKLKNCPYQSTLKHLKTPGIV